MTDWPRIIKTSDGNEIAVYEHTIALRWLNHLGWPAREHAVNVPEGEGAVDFARAVLAAAGDTGHEVVEVALVSHAIRSSEEEGARSALDRAAVWLEDHGHGRAAADQIRALPLLPDDDTTEDAITDAQDAQLPDRTGDVIDDIVIALTRREDLSEEHQAFYRSLLDRFDALASELARVRDERDRLRTAWESARRGRAEAYRQFDDARRWARILEAQWKDLRREVRAESARVSQARDERDQALQAAREVTGRLPDDDAPEPDMWARLKAEIPRLYGRERVEDLPHDSEYVTALHDVLVAMKRIERGSPPLADDEGPVDPQDEVPDLAELHELVERLALDLSETTKVVTQRLAFVETHLGITDDTTDEDPAAPVKSSLCLAESPLPTPSGYPYLCEADAGHDGDHYALRGSETWAEAAPADGILPPVRELHRMHEQEHGPTT